MTEELDRAVRLQIFGRTAEIGQVPGVQDIADALGQPRALVEESLERLAAGRVIVLSPSATTIWMANPFSAVPTGFRVYANGRTYYGNCIWDALGIPAILGADAHLEAMCGDCGSDMGLEVQSGALARSEGIIHFGVPAARWWDNIGFT
ncbi:MAG: organomercurial lyase [Armatimonadota bacterium]